MFINCVNSHEVFQIDYSGVLTRLAVNIVAHGVVIPLRDLITGQVRNYRLRLNISNRLAVLLVEVLSLSRMGHIIVAIALH